MNLLINYKLYFNTSAALNNTAIHIQLGWELNAIWSLVAEIDIEKVHILTRHPKTAV